MLNLILRCTPTMRRWRLERFVFAWVIAGIAPSVLADTTPPTAPGNTTSTSCISVVGDACIVNDADFSLRVTAATDAGGSGLNASGYQVCRSNDVTGWGGCDVSISTSATINVTVTGSHRPAPGARRAYYFRARDNAGNWGPWNNPIYIVTTSGGDITAPNPPGNTSSPHCVSVQNGTCMVNPGDFTVQVTAATDNPGGSGINTSGYNFCRSNDTSGWGGCDATLSTTAGTSFVVSGSHRPAPGQRRAYYARVRDNAGNYSNWNAPLYVQTLPDTTPPSTVPNGVARINGTSVNGLTVNVANPSIAMTWGLATDNDAVNRYNIVVQHVATGAWTYNVSVSHPSTSATVATANLQHGAQYTVWIRAIDNAGNAGTFVSLGTFSVSIADTTPPSALPSLSATIGGTSINGLTLANTAPTVVINWGLATDNVAVSRYQVMLIHNQSGGGVYNLTVNHPGTTYTLMTSGLQDGGNYSVQVRAIDSSNNNGPLRNAGTFMVRLDTTPPSAVGSFATTLSRRDIAGQQIPWNNPAIDMSWTAATDASGIKRYLVTLERVDVAGIVNSVFYSNATFSATFASSNLIVGASYRLAIKAQDRNDLWGPVTQSGVFSIAPALSSSVNPAHELMITAVSVVDDPTRGQNCGAFTFCAMMTAMAGSQDPSDFTTNFFNLFRTTQVIGPDTVDPARHVADDVLGNWPRLGDGRLDMARSPLIPLAIVNRADLVRPGDAGEARVVYGLVDSFGRPVRLTVILEYKMSEAYLSRAQWWSEWHRLNQFPDQSSPEYLAQLQYLTDSFARTPVNGRISLGQVRTNDGLRFNSTFFWEFREFMQPAANANLVQTTVKQTPFQTSTNANQIGEWINAHEAEILAESHEISAPLQHAGNDHLIGVTIPENVSNKFAGMLFSKNTCSGCHIENNNRASDGLRPFYQLQPRQRGQETRLADFFFNVPLCGVFNPKAIPECAFPYTQNELGRRRSIFESHLGWIGFSKEDKKQVSGDSQPLLMHNPTDDEVVTLDSMTRVH
ncbi:fibronectin type III domain-containing protein [Ahniella affigens]|nr:hypothetical protein [Ahniella affigens]